MRAISIACVLACTALAACAPMQRAEEPLAGKPVDELVNDLRDELAQVHWRIRSRRAACGGGALREVDLRQAAVVLTLERVAQASIGGDIKLVALPLGDIAVEPSASADYARSSARTLTMKLEVGGAPPLVDLDGAPQATRPVAQALNAAIDGFMRAGEGEPCIRLAALKLVLVIDVRKEAGGGFRVVVPAVRIAADRETRAVNTLTLEWAHVQSNGFL
jgi:hypothetical protein